MDKIEKSIQRIHDKLNQLANTIERLKLTEYIRYLSDKKRVFWYNFLIGVAKGFGAAVGFSVLGAILIVILQNLAMENIPGIGKFLAEVLEAAEKFKK